MKTITGFTLIELMITLAVLAVLVTVAVPAFQDYIHNTRMTTQANELISTFRVARTEATQRREQVAVCRFNNPQKRCDDNERWHEGWAVFTTEDGDFDEDKDEILALHDGLDGATVAAADITFVIFAESGFLTGSQEGGGDIHLCAANSDRPGRTIKVERTGRTEVTEYHGCTADD